LWRERPEIAFRKLRHLAPQTDYCLTDYCLLSPMDPTQRFSDRVENYAKFRPNYPDALIRFLTEQLPPPAAIADIGSGTGILSDQLLEAGYTVFGVEPNEPMRLEAERRLGGRLRFHSVAGTAEATTLAPGAVEAVTCAQSFHWFERTLCRSEFQRILRAPCLVLLIWNERISEGLMAEYDRILKESAPEYGTVGRQKLTDAEIAEFFAPKLVEVERFPYSQHLDRDAFIGRVLSSSYAPNVGKPGHDLFMKKIEQFFQKYAVAGWIDFPYQTRVYRASLL
jgi:SAM-dependent methyltransferase